MSSQYVIGVGTAPGLVISVEVEVEPFLPGRKVTPPSTRIVLSSFSAEAGPTESQLWTFEPGDWSNINSPSSPELILGYFIKNVGFNVVLGIPDGSTAPRTPIGVFPQSLTSLYQQWYLVPYNNIGQVQPDVVAEPDQSLFFIVNGANVNNEATNSLALNVDGGNVASGAQLDVFPQFSPTPPTLWCIPQLYFPPQLSETFEPEIQIESYLFKDGGIDITVLGTGFAPGDAVLVSPIWFETDGGIGGQMAPCFYSTDFGGNFIADIAQNPPFYGGQLRITVSAYWSGIVREMSAYLAANGTFYNATGGSVPPGPITGP
jgi:hypothetical protein